MPRRERRSHPREEGGRDRAERGPTHRQAARLRTGACQDGAHARKGTRAVLWSEAHGEPRLLDAERAAELEDARLVNHGIFRRVAARALEVEGGEAGGEARLPLEEEEGARRVVALPRRRGA